jgi:hypothetical protein
MAPKEVRECGDLVVELTPDAMAEQSDGISGIVLTMILTIGHLGGVKVSRASRGSSDGSLGVGIDLVRNVGVRVIRRVVLTVDQFRYSHGQLTFLAQSCGNTARERHRQESRRPRPRSTGKSADDHMYDARLTAMPTIAPMPSLLDLLTEAGVPLLSIPVQSRTFLPIHLPRSSDQLDAAHIKVLSIFHVLDRDHSPIGHTEPLDLVK